VSRLRLLDRRSRAGGSPDPRADPPAGGLRKRIVILGSNLAGYTAALELRKKLDAAHSIRVISTSDSFLFFPSLIWVA
jgi:hypothetical protein